MGGRSREQLFRLGNVRCERAGRIWGKIRDDKNLRDPEDRAIDEYSESATREKMMDKTLADSFPASDPPSSLPNPGEDSFL
jgi:hypothetical protein